MKRLILLAAAWIACAPAPSAAPVCDAGFPFAVEFAGCAAVPTERICQLQEAMTPLHLWVNAPGDAPLKLLGNGVELQLAPVPLEHGLAFTVLVPADWQRVELVAVNGGRWILALKKDEPHPALIRARELKASGQVEAATRALDESGPMSPRDQARAASLRARLTLGKGALEEAVAQLAASQALHHQQGAMSDEVNDALVRSYALVQCHQLTAAEEAIASVQGLFEHFCEGDAQVGYYRALAARAGGDLRRARNLLAVAEVRARRLALARQGAAIDQVMAVVLAQLGQFEEARQRFSEQTAIASTSPCDQASLRVNLAWVNHLAAEAGQRADDPQALLTEALAIYQGACPSPLEAANVGISLAWLWLQRGNPDRAATQLQSAKGNEAVMGTRLALWGHDLEGRIAMAKAHPAAALRHFRRLDALAQASASFDAIWRAAIGEAEALRALGDRRAALTALARAELELDHEGLRSPVTEGLQGLLDSRDRSARLWVSLLLEMGRTSEAFEVARHARSRALRWNRAADRVAGLDAAGRARWHSAQAEYQAARTALDQAAADDWKLPTDRLRRARAERVEQHDAIRESLEEALAALGEPARRDAPPMAEGALTLLAFPTPRRWVAFAATAAGVQAVQFDAPLADDSARWAQALLAPFDAALDRAREVVVLPYGVVRQVDVHALAWRGGPLLMSKPVRYALDLELPPGVGDASVPSGALVVGDPGGDLPFARAEAKQVAQALSSATLLLGPAGSASAVRDGLGRFGLFHFAGHGDASGQSGWDAQLQLADGHLLASDVLVLPRVPRMIVLSGCDTARTAPASLEPLGLAQAFLIAGAQSVIASTGTLDDDQAQRIVAALYREGAPAPERAAQQLQQALVGELDGGSGWRSFRVFTR